MITSPDAIPGSEGNAADPLKKAVAEFVQSFHRRRMPDLISEIERSMILRAIRREKTMKDVARTLGIGKTTLYRKMDKYGIPKYHNPTMAPR